MKTTSRTYSLALSVAAVLALGACANTQPAAYNPPAGVAAYTQYGDVQSIERVQQQNNPAGIGAGTIAGAVIGGILGNQVGGGSGQTAATVLGAAGGAYAGHNLENRNQTTTEAYRISIRMQDGSYQTVVQADSGNIRPGDRVQVSNGVARRQ